MTIRYLSLCSGIEAASVAWKPVAFAEIERLMGFPDNYTNIIFRGKPASDSPRYKALGNSMATPVIRWLGERISIAGARSTS